MSPSWNSVRTAGVFPDRAWWREQPRIGRGAEVFRQVDLPDVSGPDAVAALRALVEPGVPKGKGGAWLLGSRWFRFGILPWELQSGRNAEDRMAALIQLDGADPAALLPGQACADRVALAPARYGKGRLFAVADPALPAVLTAAAVVAPELWRPWALAAAATVLPALGHGAVVLAVVEAGQVTFLHCLGRWPEQVGVRRFPSGDFAALASLLQTEKVRQGDASLQVIADALPVAADLLRSSGFSVCMALPATLSAAGRSVVR